MTRCMNTVYTFVMPENTSDLPHELWIISLLHALDAFIKRKTEVSADYPDIYPEWITEKNRSWYSDPDTMEKVLQGAKDHLYCALIDLISDDALQPLTLHHPYNEDTLVTAYRIIPQRFNDWTWVKLYVRTK